MLIRVLGQMHAISVHLLCSGNFNLIICTNMSYRNFHVGMRYFIMNLNERNMLSFANKIKKMEVVY